ncbi:MAG: aldo/keto reductase [Oscillospiraceae bacterium]|jgi:predicted aldo/keto reductase-like oxidoreductase|nr:aldo/keto reductase [Oscillospiraceae bacterium]
MQYRTDKKTNTELSVFALGGMRIPKDYATCKQMVLEAHKAGVNYIDTAYIYSGSEEMYGKVLEETGLRDQFYIATKLPLVLTKKSEDFDKYFNRQLERLKTDHIDYYLLHMLVSPEQLVKLQSLGLEEWIAEKRANGQIRRLGFSFHGKQEDFLKLLDIRDWDFVQLQYNYSDPNYQAGVAGMKKATELGLPVMVMEPLLGGRLADSLPAEAQEVFRKANPERSLASWGFRWLYNQPEVTLCLSGVGKPEFWRDNIATANEAFVGMVTPEERATYDKVVEILRSKTKVPCTGCAYCMPCPKGVNIPGCFSAYNARNAISHYTGTQQYMMNAAFMSENYTGAAACIACRKCERHCPQNIAIVDELKAVRKTMEPLWWRIAHKAYHGKLVQKMIKIWGGN